MCLPVLLLIGARFALDLLGAQSWYEGLIFMPDLIVWLWMIALGVLLTGILRGALVLRLLRRTADTHSVRASPSEKHADSKEPGETQETMGHGRTSSDREATEFTR